MKAAKIMSIDSGNVAIMRQQNIERCIYHVTSVHVTSGRYKKLHDLRVAFFRRQDQRRAARLRDTNNTQHHMELLVEA
jgi:hypothetical protein